MDKRERPSWILYMSTYPPRECGIATFTKDLAKAMDKKFAPSLKSKILAVNNDISIYNYSRDVLFQINDSNLQDYIDVAKKINDTSDIKLVNIQHEFGIFRGEYGDFLITFLETLEKPVVVTFHTVLPKPDEKLKKVVQSIANKSKLLVVMARKAIDILKDDYNIKSDITFIPHGIPNVPLNSNHKQKSRIGLKDKFILSSFGMMNPGKGYEYVIDALPKVIKEFPNTMYIIIGETHPVVRKDQGEGYRIFLEGKVKKLGLKSHVKFYNKYLKSGEILKFLKATDIYVCSNINPHQIVSGTLSYAMGCGRSVISTPFLYAQDMVNSERGMLVDFNNSDAFSKAILKLLSDYDLRESYSRNSYLFTRHMLWDNVATNYFKAFHYYTMPLGKFGDRLPKLPEVSMRHLINLSDNFGVIQFANHAIPDISSGYTLDDNARALVVCCMHYSLFKDDSKLGLLRTYLHFIRYVQQDEGRLYNFVNADKITSLGQWSDDAHGRALWALGYVISIKSLPAGIRKEAIKIFEKAMNVVDIMEHPRGKAFAILGLYHYSRVYPSKWAVDKIKEMADFLISLYQRNSTFRWEWFEEKLTYSNSKLPEAMLYAYLATRDEKYLKVAKSTLDFLTSITYENGSFAPIGQNGWYTMNGEKAHFDQQPVDAASTIQTLILAYKVLKESIYMEKAKIALQWFLGSNHLNEVVYDEATGGCYDGLGEFSVNLNQGAESTISYLMARLCFDK